MLRSAIPLRFTYAWGQNASGAFIRTVPINSQIGIEDGAASWSTGWVPDNFTSLAGGGVPPFGQDFNGVHNITTSWDIWYQAGAPISYDATFSTNQGGYPKGAKVDSSIVLGAQWYSLVDSNTTNPDDPLTSTNWARVGIPAGTPTPFFTSSLPDGFVPMNALTIGSAASNAGVADATTLFLYVFNWLQFSNTQCPILTSAGAPSTRGANAVADFNANKQLTLPNGKGLSLIGVDTMGGAASTFLAGVPITIGNTTAPGSIVGESLHLLTTAETPAVPFSATTGSENAPHNHNYSLGVNLGGAAGGGGLNPFYALQTTTTGNENQNHAHAVSGNISGGGGSHNTTQRNMTVFWGQKK